MLREFKLNPNNSYITESHFDIIRTSMGFYKLKNRTFSVNEKNFNKLITQNNTMTYWTLDDELTAQDFIKLCKEHLEVEQKLYKTREEFINKKLKLFNSKEFGVKVIR